MKWGKTGKIFDISNTIIKHNCNIKKDQNQPYIATEYSYIDFPQFNGSIIIATELI